MAKGDSLATPHPSHPNLNDVGPRLLSVNNSGCLDNAINLSMVGGACCVGGHCDCKP